MSLWSSWRWCWRPVNSSKKPKRTTTAQTKKELAQINPEPNTCCSSQSTKAPITAEKKKRQTHDEVAAAKAEAENDKQCLNELTREVDRQLAQMDINEDTQRQRGRGDHPLILRHWKQNVRPQWQGVCWIWSCIIIRWWWPLWWGSWRLTGRGSFSVCIIHPPLTMGWYSLMHRRHTKNSRQKWQPSKRSYWEQRGKAAVRLRSLSFSISNLVMIWLWCIWCMSLQWQDNKDKHFHIWTPSWLE